MKRLIGVVSVTCLLSFYTFGQTSEIGVGFGTSNFLGDLGKKQPHGNTYYGDLEASLFRPAASAFYRNHFNYRWAVKIGLTYARFEGDDKLAKSENIYDDEWYRNYRNIHFRSNVMEIGVTAEFNILKYIPGSPRYWITPYIFTGINMLYFNPKAEYNGEWIALQPLGTEGQGMPGYPDRKKYSRIQPSMPFGIGLKYNINRFLSLGFEIGHRITFTDYIDDVSTTYVTQQEFVSFYGEEKGNMIYELSRRSPEIDPEGTNAIVTSSGQIRGNPGENDAYLISTLSLSYKFANKFSDFSLSHRRSSNRRKSPLGRNRSNRYKRHIKARTW